MCTLLYWYSFDVYSVVPVSFFSVGRTGLMQMQSLMRFVNINAKSRYTVPKFMIIIEHTTVQYDKAGNEVPVLTMFRQKYFLVHTKNVFPNT